MTRLEQIKSRWEATKGYPWAPRGVCLNFVESTVSGNFICEAATVESAELIAHAPEDIAYLIKRVEELEREKERFGRNLDGRDKFIVDKGLWLEFVDSLPITKADIAWAEQQAQEIVDADES